jgi:hypothetical protein
MSGLWHPHDVDTSDSRVSAGQWIQIWSRALSAALMTFLFLFLGVVTLLQTGADEVSGVGYLAMAIGALGLLLGELGLPPSAPEQRRVYIAVQVLLAASIVLISFWQAFR